MVILALGSNLGDRLRNLSAALRMLHSASGQLRVKKVSSIYETEPYLLENSPSDWNKSYLNCVLTAETTLDAEHLLFFVKDVERRLGRKEAPKWAPRVIDIDIIAAGENETIVQKEQLHVPHKRMLERDFVLVPLSEICPDWRYPLSGPSFNRTAKELTTELRLKKKIDCFSEIAGIINITPDSFSGDGLASDPLKVVDQMIRMIEDGATVLDIGAESTRPQARAVDPEEEWGRLSSVLQEFQKLSLAMNRPLISVDTRNAETAKRAIEFGADWINDVTGFEDERMRAVVRESNVDLVVMHSLGIPPSKENVLNTNEDPTEQLIKWAEKRLKELEEDAINRERIIIDPGIGFGKTAEQAWQIMSNIERLHDLGVRILLGHSRKSYLQLVTSKPASERDPETAAISAYCSAKGVDYFRVHNVGDNIRALKAVYKLNGILDWS